MEARHLMAFERIEKKPKKRVMYQLTEYENEYFDEFRNEMNIYYEMNAHEIKDVFSAKLRKMTFIYDFGDDWKVKVFFEKTHAAKENDEQHLPHVLEGEGMGIVEDIGGAYALEEAVEAMKNSEWYKRLFNEDFGMEEFDIHQFDLAEMNKRIKELPARYDNYYQKMYE
jgi:hypothetical protein